LIVLVEALEKSLLVRFRDRSVRLVPGIPVDLGRDEVRRLLAKAPGKVRLVGACSGCGSLRFWLSIYDSLLCSICHPPAHPDLLKEWLEVRS
jgi:hypothetical protein